MNAKRILHTVRIGSGAKRAQYLPDKKVFAGIGEQCAIMNRKVSLYPDLIKSGNTVHMASDAFITHDRTHRILHQCPDKIFLENIGEEQSSFIEKLGCIEISAELEQWRWQKFGDKRQ